MHRNTRLSIALVMGAALLAAGPAQGQSADSQMCEENCVCPDGSAAQMLSLYREVSGPRG